MLKDNSWKKYCIASVITVLLYGGFFNSAFVLTLPLWLLRMVDIILNLLFVGFMWLAIVCKKKDLEKRKLVSSKTFKVLKILEIVIPILFVITNIQKIFS